MFAIRKMLFLRRRGGGGARTARKLCISSFTTECYRTTRILNLMRTSCLVVLHSTQYKCRKLFENNKCDGLEELFIYINTSYTSTSHIYIHQHILHIYLSHLYTSTHLIHLPHKFIYINTSYTSTSHIYIHQHILHIYLSHLHTSTHLPLTFFLQSRKIKRVIVSFNEFLKFGFSIYICVDLYIRNQETKRECKDEIIFLN